LCRDAAWRRYFFQAEDGIRDRNVTGVQTCALPISRERGGAVPPRVLEQRLGDLQELLLRRAADLLYHLRRVAAEVFLQELEHAEIGRASCREEWRRQESWHVGIQ